MIWLVRHPPVALHWQNKCYGVSDMGLSRDGMTMAKRLVLQLLELAPDIVIHSDMKRTRPIAEQVALNLGIETRADRRFRERNFGTWEGRSWDAIYRETGNAMDGMLNDPENFRPGDGETTAELSTRSNLAWSALPTDRRVIVITHGGPIAAISNNLHGMPLNSLADHIPETGSVTPIVR